MTIADFTAAGSFALLLLSVIGGVWWRIHARISQVERDGVETQKRNDAALNQFKLEAYQKFIHSESLEKMERRQLQAEERMVASINDLGKRLERIADRIDKFISNRE